MESTGIPIVCVCGSSFTASAVDAGRPAQCPRCSYTLLIPRAPSGIPKREEKGATKTNSLFCSICQTTIGIYESAKECPQCRLPFHQECWQDNFGCSAYGCPQVSCLKSGPDIRISLAIPSETPFMPTASIATSNPVLEIRGTEDCTAYLLLAANILCFVLGLFLFGFPALLCAIVTLCTFLFSTKTSATFIYWLGIGLGILGQALGFLTSWVLFVRP